MWDKAKKKILMAGPKKAVQEHEKAVQWYKRQGTIKYKGASYVPVYFGWYLTAASDEERKERAEFAKKHKQLKETDPEAAAKFFYEHRLEYQREYKRKQREKNIEEQLAQLKETDPAEYARQKERAEYKAKRKQLKETDPEAAAKLLHKHRLEYQQEYKRKQREKQIEQLKETDSAEYARQKEIVEYKSKRRQLRKTDPDAADELLRERNRAWQLEYRRKQRDEQIEQLKETDPAEYERQKERTEFLYKYKQLKETDPEAAAKLLHEHRLVLDKRKREKEQLKRKEIKQQKERAKLAPAKEELRKRMRNRTIKQFPKDKSQPPVPEEIQEALNDIGLTKDVLKERMERRQQGLDPNTAVPVAQEEVQEEVKGIGFAKDIIKERIKERKLKRQQMNANVVKYKGAYYRLAATHEKDVQWYKRQGDADEDLDLAKETIKDRIKERQRGDIPQRTPLELVPRRILTKEELLSKKKELLEKLKETDPEAYAREQTEERLTEFVREQMAKSREHRRLLPTKKILRQRMQEREQQMNANVVKYKGAYYRPVEALQQHFDPSKRLPVGNNVGDAASSEFQVMQIDMWLEGAEKEFDALVASPGMEKYDDKRKAIDAYITKARAALKNLKALTGRMGDKIESQQETIARFQNALKELQTKRAASVQRTSEKMATQEKAPEMVKYAGHLYVLAEDEEKEEEKEDKEEEQMEGEAGEEIELLDALKGHWQTILDKLPDDLEVDEEFEAALNGIDEVIAVMDKIHAEYADEAAGEEESSEEEPEGE